MAHTPGTVAADWTDGVDDIHGGDLNALSTTALGAVPNTRTVNGHALTANITVTPDDQTDGTTNKVYTATEKTKLAAISGTNTGDQTLNGLLPTQTGQSGKFLTTSGTAASWGTPAGGGSATPTPTASTPSEWDANVNFAANAFIPGFFTQAGSGTTITMTVSSAQTTVITGTTTAQTIKLPTTSVIAGDERTIINQMTGANVTVQSSAANTILVLGPGETARFRALATTPTTAANWKAAQYTIDSDFVYLDSFPGTDDQKLTAAMAYASAQTQIPAIVFPARAVTFSTSGRTPYSGMKLIGPRGASGPKAPEVSTSLCPCLVVLNVGTGTSSWFNGTADTYGVLVADLAFQGGSGSGLEQFWHQPSTTLYGCEFRSLSFYGMKSIFGNSSSTCAFTQVDLTGHWNVVGFTDTQFNIVGSDNQLWVDGYCNIGTSQAVGTGVYYIMFGVLEKTKVGFIYSTVGTGWKSMLLGGSTSSWGVTFFGGVHEGTTSIPATKSLIDITGGWWVFFGTTFDYVASTGNNGVITQSGGILATYSCTYTRLPATAATFPFLYQTAGTAYINNTISTNAGENCYATWANGQTTALPQQNGPAIGTGLLAPVQVVTGGAETYTITSGSVTQISGTTINGYTAAIGDRVLVSTAPAASGPGPGVLSTVPGNGLYVVIGNTTNITLARSLDMSGPNHPAGLTVWAEAGGASGALTFWTVATPASIDTAFTWGTSNIGYLSHGGQSPVMGNALMTNGYVQSTLNLNNGAGYSGLVAGTPGGSQTLTLPSTPTADTLRGLVPRIGTTASSATPSIACNLYDQYNITALAAAITGVTITGTPLDGQDLTIRITGTGARAITWGSSFLPSGSQALLTTTATTKTHLNRFRYDSVTAKWICVYVDTTGY